MMQSHATKTLTACEATVSSPQLVTSEQGTFLFLLTDKKYTDSDSMNGGPHVRVSSPLPTCTENITRASTFYLFSYITIFFGCFGTWYQYSI